MTSWQSTALLTLALVFVSAAAPSTLHADGPPQPLRLVPREAFLKPAAPRSGAPAARPIGKVPESARRSPGGPRRPTAPASPRATQARTPAARASMRPPRGARTPVAAVVRDTLTPAGALEYQARYPGWAGPSIDPAKRPLPSADPGTEAQPYARPQATFVERKWVESLSDKDLHQVMRGEVLVMREPRTGQTDIVMRDHHTLDAVLYHYRTGGVLPDTLLHVDRHSDYVLPTTTRGAQSMGYNQPNSWWHGLMHLKRPSGRPLVGRVFYATDVAPPEEYPKERPMLGMLTGSAYGTPPGDGRDDLASLKWPAVREALRAASAKQLGHVMASIDLDLFHPGPQFARTSSMYNDPLFRQLVSQAKVRLFVMSPNFLRGGDALSEWRVHQPELSSAWARVNEMRSPDFAKQPRATR